MPKEVATNSKKLEKNEIKFAIIKTGGKQYKVSVGDVLKVEKIVLEKGKSLEFTDLLNGQKVTAEIVSDGKLPKVTIVKFRPKKRYHKTQGHRQNYTEIKITKIV